MTGCTVLIELTFTMIRVLCTIEIGLMTDGALGSSAGENAICVTTYTFGSFMRTSQRVV